MVSDQLKIKTVLCTPTNVDVFTVEGYLQKGYATGLIKVK